MEYLIIDPADSRVGRLPRLCSLFQLSGVSRQLRFETATLPYTINAFIGVREDLKFFATQLPDAAVVAMTRRCMTSRLSIMDMGILTSNLTIPTRQPENEDIILRWANRRKVVCRELSELEGNRMVTRASVSAETVTPED
jgi:hypothetical protein